MIHVNECTIIKHIIFVIVASLRLSIYSSDEKYSVFCVMTSENKRFRKEAMRERLFISMIPKGNRFKFLFQKKEGGYKNTYQKLVKAPDKDLGWEEIFVEPSQKGDTSVLRFYQVETKPHLKHQSCMRFYDSALSAYLGLLVFQLYEICFFP